MLITLDIKNESKKESFINFLSTLDYIEIKSQEEEKKNLILKKTNLMNLLNYGKIKI